MKHSRMIVARCVMSIKLKSVGKSYREMKSAERIQPHPDSGSNIYISSVIKILSTWPTSDCSIITGFCCRTIHMSVTKEFNKVSVKGV